MESDTEVATDFCSVCDTPEFSTSGPESCPIRDTPEFPTTPSRKVDVAVCIGPGNRMEDLWSSSADTPVCESRSQSFAETILYDDDLHRVAFWTHAQVTCPGSAQRNSEDLPGHRVVYAHNFPATNLGFTC